MKILPTTVPMTRFFLWAFLTCAAPALAQTKIDSIVSAEHRAGHFNGAVLVVKNGQIISQLNKGFANLQFSVPITPNTRFPVASVTKLFTAILTLQLVEKSLLALNNKASVYLPDLPPDCQNITVAELLTHTSGLKNEPVKAYSNKYSSAEFVKQFVIKDKSSKASLFNYNNVDYIILTRILEIVTKKSFAALVQDSILKPLKMNDSGVIDEARVIPNLAYGYHNYTFGRGSHRDTLRNDTRYLSNYAGAGAIYSTVADLYKLITALQTNKLLSAKMTALMLKPQHAEFIDYARGYPATGFYYNDKTFPKPILERRGSIDGFNSVVLTNENFAKVVIILTNTDTSNLELIGDKLYAEIN